ncbi:hypothetical protein ABIC71_000925 [Herbaspirillum seropedicae]|uniref:hypothetical protein n=1 Tax=Herbaspirillum seropedicae TaxID=964 RepID=UPI0033960966
MYDLGEIHSAIQQRGRLNAHAGVFKEIFSAEADEPWAAAVHFSRVGDAHDFDLSGVFGTIRAEFEFGKATIAGGVRYAGRYNFRLLGRGEESKQIWSVVLTNGGDLVGVDRMPPLNEVGQEMYPAAKRHLLGFVLQHWVQELTRFE